jgi:hypothetical protein
VKIKVILVIPLIVCVECFHIQGMRVTPHKERGDGNMSCEDFCATESFISRFVSRFMQDSKTDPLQ